MKSLEILPNEEELNQRGEYIDREGISNLIFNFRLLMIHVINSQILKIRGLVDSEISKIYQSSNILTLNIILNCSRRDVTSRMMISDIKFIYNEMKEKYIMEDWRKNRNMNGMRESQNQIEKQQNI